MPNDSRNSPLIRLAVAAAFGLALPAFAQLDAASPAQPAPTPPAATPTINPPQAPIPPAGSPAAAAQPGQPKPFKEVVKDAKESDGFFKIFHKEDKTWIEIKPDQFEKPFFLSTIATQSLGERRLY